MTAFFAAWRGASVRLAGGWFGRPYDSRHTLRCVQDADGVLLIGLDEYQLLTIRTPAVLEVDGRVLRLSGFAEASWEWTEYGGTRRHAERFTDGVIELCA